PKILRLKRGCVSKLDSLDVPLGRRAEPKLPVFEAKAVCLGDHAVGEAACVFLLVRELDDVSPIVANLLEKPAEDSFRPFGIGDSSLCGSAEYLRDVVRVRDSP